MFFCCVTGQASRRPSCNGFVSCPPRRWSRQPLSLSVTGADHRAAVTRRGRGPATGCTDDALDMKRGGNTEQRRSLASFIKPAHEK